MKIHERAEVVRAMETIARCVNDEEVFEYWLMVGVADGDIDESTTDEDIDEMGYITDSTLKDLMTRFLKLMGAAWESGGLYCDRVCSEDAEG